jgi:hypothetical protein
LRESLAPLVAFYLSSICKQGHVLRDATVTFCTEATPRPSGREQQELPRKAVATWKMLPVAC